MSVHIGSMEIMSNKKFTCLVLMLCFFVILTFLFLYFPFHPYQDIYKTKLIKEKNVYESRNLGQVIKRAAKEDRIVILTIVSEELAKPGSVLDLFLESFRIGDRTEKFLNHLVVVAADIQAFQYCQSIHHHCFDYTNSRRKLSAENQLRSHDCKTIHQKNVYILHDVIRLGYSFLFTDPDVIWFRNPFSHFDPIIGVTTASDLCSGNQQNKGKRPDGGFFYVNANDITTEVFKWWKLEMVLYPDTNENFAEIITSNFPTLELRVKYLDAAYFGGIFQHNINMNQVHTIHGNCCSDTESKVHDLRLLLDHWKNFTAHPRGNNLGELSSWKSQLKCRSQMITKYVRLNIVT